jgi:hypothetical protein
MRHAEINDVYKPSRRSSAPLPTLSRPSYSSKILALYAEYVLDRAFTGTSGPGTSLLELTGGGLLARPLRTRFLFQILPHLILIQRILAATSRTTTWQDPSQAPPSRL